jgi:DNA-directed RNA polymerase subunit K/omega
MRSEYVFAAAKEISNRFLLCRVTSVSARRLHIASSQPTETINKSLRLIATRECAGARNDSDGNDSVTGEDIAVGGSELAGEPVMAAWSTTGM